MATATETLLPLSEIRCNGGCQLRVEISQDVVQDYAEILDELPPVIVFDDGNHYWLADGFHRLKAARLAGRDGIHCEVRQGSRRDAILFAAGANGRHGLRRSNADKRRAVMALLSDKEWCRWSDCEIARQCAVGAHLVHALRQELAGPHPQPTRFVHRGSSVYQMRVGKIGQHQHEATGRNGARNGATVTCPFCRRRFKVP